MSTNENSEQDGTEVEQCEYEGCTDEATLKNATGKRYCGHDHSAADRNGWEPEELSAYEVEHDGEEATYRAPSKDSAVRQWRSVVIAKRGRA